MNTDIELYRACRLDSSEYIISNSIDWIGDKLYLKDDVGDWIECDPSTRAVSYVDMVDCDNERLFASLQPFSKGGDIFECSYDNIPKIHTAACSSMDVVNVYSDHVDYDGVTRNKAEVKN